VRITKNNNITPSTGASEVIAAIMAGDGAPADTYGIVDDEVPPKSSTHAVARDRGGRGGRVRGGYWMDWASGGRRAGRAHQTCSEMNRSAFWGVGNDRVAFR